MLASAELQRIGSVAKEIKEFLEVHDQGDLPCEHIKVKLEDKLCQIEHERSPFDVLIATLIA